MYAVLESGGKQYRVSPGDQLDVEKLEAEVGKPFTFERVLLVADEGKVAIGSPTVAQATVVADVLEHIRGPKTHAFKMHRRKGYHHTSGHRQDLTRVRISQINA